MYFAYSFLLGLALIITLPWWLVQMLRAGKYRAGLAERLGGVPARLQATSDSENCIWVHAVSVGEVLAVSGLLATLRDKFPGWRIVISTTTLTGQKLARERYGEENVFYLPLDFGFALAPFLARLRPRMLVLAETEFWPNLLGLVRRSGAKIAVVNGRISDRSFPRYRRFRSLLRRVLENVDVFLAQSALDKDRLIAIGADPARVQVSGNLKFDVKAPPQTKLVAQLRAAIPAGSPVLVCGSTVEGEEPLLLAAFKELLAETRDAVLVLAPRHPERFDAVVRQLTASALSFVRRTSWQGEALTGKVVLLDTIGELASVYQLATVAFVGGSLVPRGGHNILEPAQYGKPILVGPHTENFRDIVGIFTAEKALRVTAASTVYYEWHLLLSSPQMRDELGKRALGVFTSQQGATQRTLDALEVLLWMPSTVADRMREVRS